MGRHPDADDAEETTLKDAKRQYWRDYLQRIEDKRTTGAYALNTPYEQADYIHALKGSTFMKGVEGRPDVPSVDESTTLLKLSTLLGQRTYQIPRAVSTRNPYPTLEWGFPRTDGMSVPGIAAIAIPITAAAVSAAGLLTRFVKWLTIKADPANTAVVYFTADGTTPPVFGATGFPLSAGESIRIPLEDLTNLAFISSGGSQTMALLLVQDLETWQ